MIRNVIQAAKALLLLTVVFQISSAYVPCPSTPENLTIDFPTELRLVTFQQKKVGCKQALECTVFSTPPNTEIEFYKNNAKIVEQEATDSVSNMFGTHMIGMSEVSHRICLDDILDEKEAEFVCRAKINCGPKPLSIDSNPLAVIKTNEGVKKRFLRQLPENQAPFIYMNTNTRIELPSLPVELICRARGNPSPKVHWRIFEDYEQNISHDVGDYPYAYVLPNGDLSIDSQSLKANTLTVLCIAHNTYGTDSSISTLILMDE